MSAHHRPHILPLVSIMASGRLHFTEGALKYYDLNNKYIDIYYDERRKILGFKLSDKTSSIKVRNLVGFKAFINYLNINKFKSNKYVLTKCGDYLAIDLTSPVTMSHSTSSRPYKIKSKDISHVNFKHIDKESVLLNLYAKSRDDEQREFILEEFNSGKTYMEIGNALNISRQRVQQIVSEYKLRRRDPTKQWTFKECYEIAKKCKNSTEWAETCPKSYAAAITNKWLKECTKHFTRKRTWALEDLKEDAAKYKTAQDWLKHSRRNYRIAIKFNVFEKCAPHLKRIRKPKRPSAVLASLGII